MWARLYVCFTFPQDMEDKARPKGVPHQDEASLGLFRYRSSRSSIYLCIQNCPVRMPPSAFLFPSPHPDLKPNMPSMGSNDALFPRSKRDVSFLGQVSLAPSP